MFSLQLVNLLDYALTVVGSHIFATLPKGNYLPTYPLLCCDTGRTYRVQQFVNIIHQDLESLDAAILQCDIVCSAYKLLATEVPRRGLSSHELTMTPCDLQEVLCWAHGTQYNFQSDVFFIRGIACLCVTVLNQCHHLEEGATRSTVNYHGHRLIRDRKRYVQLSVVTILHEPEKYVRQALQAILDRGLRERVRKGVLREWVEGVVLDVGTIIVVVLVADDVGIEIVFAVRDGLDIGLLLGS